ncbi:hypothetical protein UMZ34_13880 [Halopseudomonas pachastrellae]|nr:hypothetical protein UMZ34_13880 [Halopseudomonas pachastrellae]
MASIRQARHVDEETRALLRGNKADLPAHLLNQRPGNSQTKPGTAATPATGAIGLVNRSKTLS